MHERRVFTPPSCASSILPSDNVVGGEGSSISLLRFLGKVDFASLGIPVTETEAFKYELSIHICMIGSFSA